MGACEAVQVAIGECECAVVTFGVTGQFMFVYGFSSHEVHAVPIVDTDGSVEESIVEDVSAEVGFQFSIMPGFCCRD